MGHFSSLVNSMYRSISEGYRYYNENLQEMKDFPGSRDNPTFVENCKSVLAYQLRQKELTILKKSSLPFRGFVWLGSLGQSEPKAIVYPLKVLPKEDSGCGLNTVTIVPGDHLQFGTEAEKKAKEYAPRSLNRKAAQGVGIVTLAALVAWYALQNKK